MKKILIIDDDADIIELVTNRLKKNNYDTSYANDGDSGFEIAVKEKPDLIIMDILMPKMQGGEAVKLLRSNESTKNTPILFFTAMIPSGAENDKVNVNGQFYPAISKPFDPEKLLSTIKSLLGG